MKITVIEFREAKFKEYENLLPSCRINTTYEVRVTSGQTQGTRRFYHMEAVEEYIKYLKEQKNDYRKVIKEIEI